MEKKIIIFVTTSAELEMGLAIPFVGEKKRKMIYRYGKGTHIARNPLYDYFGKTCVVTLVIIKPTQLLQDAS